MRALAERALRISTTSIDRSVNHFKAFLQVVAAALTYGNLDVLPRNDRALDACCRAPPDKSCPRWKQHLPWVRGRGYMKGAGLGYPIYTHIGWVIFRVPFRPPGSRGRNSGNLGVAVHFCNIPTCDNPNTRRLCVYTLLPKRVRSTCAAGEGERRRRESTRVRFQILNIGVWMECVGLSVG